MLVGDQLLVLRLASREREVVIAPLNVMQLAGLAPADLKARKNEMARDALVVIADALSNPHVRHRLAMHGLELKIVKGAA
jgi:hypothetical protein